MDNVDNVSVTSDIRVRVLDVLRKQNGQIAKDENGKPICVEVFMIPMREDGSAEEDNKIPVKSLLQEPHKYVLRTFIVEL